MLWHHMHIWMKTLPKQVQKFPFCNLFVMSAIYSIILFLKVSFLSVNKTVKLWSDFLSAGRGRQKLRLRFVHSVPYGPLSGVFKMAATTRTRVRPRGASQQELSPLYPVFTRSCTCHTCHTCSNTTNATKIILHLWPLEQVNILGFSASHIEISTIDESCKYPLGYRTSFVVSGPLDRDWNYSHFKSIRLYCSTLNWSDCGWDPYCGL
jgi:hypothetical protein